MPTNALSFLKGLNYAHSSSLELAWSTFLVLKDTIALGNP